MRASGSVSGIDGGGGGGGTVSLITSTDSSVIITDPGGPTVDLSVTPASIGALALSGGTMTGDIDMDGNSVVNSSLITAPFAISTTTAALGFAHVYEATAADITLTVSTADLAVDGRKFRFKAPAAGVSNSTPIEATCEAGQTIDGGTSIFLIVNDARSTLLQAIGGNLESV